MKDTAKTTLLMTAVLVMPAATPAAPVGASAQIGGIEMHYELAGEGEPLLLLHSGTQTVRMWDPFVEALAAKYGLILVDLRGHGGSTNPDGLWTTRQFARDVLGLLDHLGIGRVKAIGASAGAMTLLHMAIEQPERIEAMVVIGVGTYLPTSCRQILAKTDGDAFSEETWQQYRAIHPGGDAQIRALFDWVASLADSYEDMAFTPPHLATIKARTLVVHGDRDYCFPASMAWDIYQAIPKAYLWVVPNGGHVPLQGPQVPAFTEKALAFLRGAWDDP